MEDINKKAISKKMKKNVLKFNQFIKENKDSLNDIYFIYIGDEQVYSSDDLKDSFEHIGKLSLEKGIISNEQFILFNDKVNDILDKIGKEYSDVQQNEIDWELERLLDDFTIIVNFDIIKKSSLEQEPEEIDFDMEDELDYFLDYSDETLLENLRKGNHYKKYLNINNFNHKEISTKKSEYKKSYLITNKTNAPIFSGVLNILKDGRAIMNANYTTYSGVKNKYTNYYDKDGYEIIDKDNSTTKERKYFYSLNESVNIKGIKNGKEFVLDTFDNEDIANEILKDYEEIYSEYEKVFVDNK